MYLVNCVLGDYSADGHGLTSSFVLKCSVDRDGLIELVNRGQDITGIRLDSLCDNYEDNSIPNGVYNYMKSKGIEFDKYEEEVHLTTGESMRIYDEQYINLMIALAKEGDSEAVIEFSTEVQNFNTGYGYGLFSL